MLKSRRKIIPNTSNADTGLMMNLSLFIMLLAFFIVLNAISSFDDTRAEPIVNNLQMVFSTDVYHKDVRPSLRPNPLEALHQGETVERIEALFDSQITGVEAVKNATGKTLQVEVPLSEFSTRVMALNQKDLIVEQKTSAEGAFFLPTLISLLKSDEAGHTYRMDLIFGVEGNPAQLQNESPEEVRKIIRRAGQLVRKIEEAGLSQRLLSFGLQDGDPSVVTISFRRHAAFNPKYGQAEDQE